MGIMEQEPIRLPLLNCFGADFLMSHPKSNLSESFHSENRSNVVCSPTSGTCYTCPLVSGYLSQDISQGRAILFTLWTFIILIGVIGVVTNLFNIILLLGKSPPCGPSLSSLLIPLSVFDMLASGFAVSYSTLSVLIIENMSRSWLTMSLYHFSLVTYLLGRTGSLFIAVLITFERYLVLAHPFKSKSWLTIRKTRIAAGITCLLTLVSNLPRYFSVRLVENVGAKDIPALMEFSYLFHSTWVGILFYKRAAWIGKLHFLLDFLLPLPILLILNAMLFRKIAQVNSQRRLLTASQRSEISSARMFMIVISVLLLCHIFPICFYIDLTLYKTVYRELAFGTTLSVTVNSSVNFIIYFYFGKLFRQRVILIIGKLRGRCKLCSCTKDHLNVPHIITGPKVSNLLPINCFCCDGCTINPDNNVSSNESVSQSQTPQL